MPLRESDIQRQFLAVVGPVVGVFVERINTGMAMDPRTGRAVRFGTPGSPDIRITMGGRSIAVELKSATGRQSVEQKRWQAAFESAGGVYLLVNDVSVGVRRLAEFAPDETKKMLLSRAP